MMAKLTVRFWISASFAVDSLAGVASNKILHIWTLVPSNVLLVETIRPSRIVYSSTYHKWSLEFDLKEIPSAEAGLDKYTGRSIRALDFQMSNSDRY